MHGNLSVGQTLRGDVNANCAVLCETVRWHQAFGLLEGVKLTWGGNVNPFKVCCRFSDLDQPGVMLCGLDFGVCLDDPPGTDAAGPSDGIVHWRHVEESKEK